MIIKLSQSFNGLIQFNRYHQLNLFIGFIFFVSLLSYDILKSQKNDGKINNINKGGYIKKYYGDQIGIIGKIY